ncbi:hypothetical protein CN187_08930 [Sinorhizobium meliloti]|uniref:hypothetical protein n=1 Tax=Rhizobium meliloti TaxID=382 RepID=UPI000FD95F42|nr:hypothetical protein [Sinorhizobium meliloti]RVI69317.1 hypothetical protein CN187_08930 [Sinorhizobium meliloti]
MASVGKVRIGSGPDDVVVIIDNGSPPLHVDLFTEIAEEEGIFRISFAALTQDGEGQKGRRRGAPENEKGNRLGAMPSAQGAGQS